MANFDEDIKRITDEILSDGTVDHIIREKLTKGIESAISNSFSYGKLEKAIKERVEQVLVPFIEGYDMSSYIVKLDTILTEIVNKSVLVDNKKLLENFRFLMEEPDVTEIKLTDLFMEYKKFVAKNMDTSGRKVEWKDDDLVEELDRALASHYPEDLDNVRRYLQNAIDHLDLIESECKAGNK